MTAPQTPTPGSPLSSESVKLLACPLCGMTDSEENATQESGLLVRSFPSPAGGMACQVECACGARGPAAREEWQAAEKWNRRLSTPSDQGEAIPLDAEARAEAWADQAEVQAMVDALSEVFRKWAPQPILSRFREQMMAVLQQAFIEGTMRPTTPASGSDGLIERLRVQKVIPSGPVDGNLWMPRNPDGSEAADALEAAEKRIADLNAEVERWKSAYDIAHDQATANGSQVAALKAALEKASEDISAWAEECGGTGWQDVLAEDLKSIDQALALKEGR